MDNVWNSVRKQNKCSIKMNWKEFDKPTLMGYGKDLKFMATFF